MSRSGPSFADRYLGGPLPRGTTALLGAELGVFLLIFFVLGGPEWVRLHLALSPARALGPEPWQLVTSALVHLSIGRLLSSLLGILFVANFVERRRGTAGMLTVFAATQIGGALGFAAAGRLLGWAGLFDGCMPAVLGLTAVVGASFGREQVSLFGAVQLRARTLALILIGLSAVTDLLNRDYPTLASTVAAAGIGYGLAAGGGGIGTRLQDGWDRLRLWRLRRRYKVIQGGKSEGRFVN